MTTLTEHNRRVREWADSQPAKYRKSAQAFGYPADKDSCSHDYTLKQLAGMSRRRRGQGVSRSKLADDLRAFVACGAITVERRRMRNRNMSSVYHIDFTKSISEAEDVGKRQRRRIPASSARPTAAADDKFWLEPGFEPDEPACRCFSCWKGNPSKCLFKARTEPVAPASKDLWADS